MACWAFFYFGKGVFKTNESAEKYITNTFPAIPCPDIFVINIGCKFRFSSGTTI